MRQTLNIRITRLEERLKAADQARHLQAAEYARRLEVLNHAHEKADQVQRTYVAEEIYNEKHEALQNRVTVLETWRANMMGRAIAISVVGSLFISILTALVVHNTHF